LIRLSFKVTLDNLFKENIPRQLKFYKNRFGSEIALIMEMIVTA